MQDAIALAADTLQGPPKPEDLEPLSFTQFVRESWPILEPGRDFLNNWSVEAIIDHLIALVYGDIKKLVINVPPGSMKSLLTCVMLPAWIWGEVNPGFRMIFSSYANSLAVRDSTKCRRLIKSPWYQRRYGHVFQILKDEDTKSKYENNRTGFRQCTSPKALGTGIRGDLVACLPYNELISTDAGLLKIGEIVEKELTPKVKGFDHATGKVVWAEILNHQKNPFRPLTQIKTDRRQLELTDDHEVYVLGKGYVCAASIVIGDLIITEHEKQTRNPNLPRMQAGIFYSTQQDFSILHLPVLLQQQARSSNDLLFCLWNQVLSFSRARSKKCCELLLQSLLRQDKLRKSQFSLSIRENRDYLHSLPKTIFRETWNSWPSKDLLIRLSCPCSKDTGAGTSNLSLLQSIVFCSERQKNRLLFPKLCQQGSWPQNDGKWQQQLCAWGLRWRVSNFFPQSTCQVNSVQGQGGLPNLWHDRSPTWFQTLFSPHQLHQEGRSTRESDQSVPFLSRRNAWESKQSNPLAIEIVRAVNRSQRVESCTYNIATSTKNYFASHILIHNCDDPIKTTEAASEKKRQFAVDWWNTEMSNRGSDRDARFLVIMQRLHEFDVAGACIEQGYELLKIPQEYEPKNTIVTCLGWKDPRTQDGELMWPERFDEAFVESQQLVLGDYAYSGQHQQRPTPAEGGIIKRAYLEERYDYHNPPPFEAVMVTADTAQKPGVLNAYSVFLALGITQNKYYLIDVYRKKVDQPTLVEDFYNFCNKHKPSVALVEDKSSGAGLIQYAQKETRISVIPVKPEKDKETRLINESPALAARKLLLPMQGQTPWLFDLIDELTTAPNGEYMDQCDALSQLLEYLRMTWQPKTGAALLRGKKKASN
jgi:predicted phage terminase large subunit-like protein